MSLDVSGARDRKRAAEAAQLSEQAMAAKAREKRVAPIRDALQALGREAAAELMGAGVVPKQRVRKRYASSKSPAVLERTWTEEGWSFRDGYLMGYGNIAFLTTSGTFEGESPNLIARDSDFDWLAGDTAFSIDAQSGRLVASGVSHGYDDEVGTPWQLYVDDGLSAIVVNLIDAARQAPSLPSPNSPYTPEYARELAAGSALRKDEPRRGFWARIFG